MKKPACLNYGMTPRLIPVEVAASYCGMSIEEFEDFYTGHAVRSRRAKPLYDVRALDIWLDQRSGLAKGTPNPGEYLKGLGSGAAKKKAANVG